MAWYSKAFDGKIEEHREKKWALSRCNFAAAGGESVNAMGVYKRDPRKHADEPNVLPTEIEKAQARTFAKQIRGIMGRNRKSRVAA